MWIEYVILWPNTLRTHPHAHTFKPVQIIDRWHKPTYKLHRNKWQVRVSKQNEEKRRKKMRTPNALSHNSVKRMYEYKWKMFALKAMLCHFICPHCLELLARRVLFSLSLSVFFACFYLFRCLFLLFLEFFQCSLQSFGVETIFKIPKWMKWSKQNNAKVPHSHPHTQTHTHSVPLTIAHNQSTI